MAVLHVSPAQRNCPLLYDRAGGAQNPPPCTFSNSSLPPTENNPTLLSLLHRVQIQTLTQPPARTPRLGILAMQKRRQYYTDACLQLVQPLCTTSACNTPGQRPRIALYNRTHRTYTYDVGDDNLTLSISHSHSHNVTVMSTANDRKPLRASRTRSTRREYKHAGGEKKDSSNGAFPFTLAH